MIKEMIRLADSGGVSLQSFQNAIHYIEQFQSSISLHSAMKAHGISSGDDNMIGVHDVQSPLDVTISITKDTDSTNANFVPTKTTSTIRDLIIAGLKVNRAVVCVGPKGSYKSSIANETAKSVVVQMELFSLHPDMTARDLLMVRGTNECGDTSWRETPLTRAARKGTMVVLDGIDKLRSDTLTSLALLLEQGCAVLPDGTRFYADNNFRCVALAHPTNDRSWISPEIRSIFHWIKVSPLPAEELRDVIECLFPSLDRNILDKLLQLQQELDHVSVDSAAEKESLLLTMRKIKHICKRVERNPNELGRIINNTLMTSFLPECNQGIIKNCLAKCGIDVSDSSTTKEFFNKELSDKLIKECRREASNPLLVPNPRFEENSGQALSELDILESHSVGEKALLITGFQGVGKNKIVDRLLSKLNCEREYM